LCGGQRAAARRPCEIKRTLKEQWRKGRDGRRGVAEGRLATAAHHPLETMHSSYCLPFLLIRPLYVGGSVHNATRSPFLVISDHLISPNRVISFLVPSFCGFKRVNLKRRRFVLKKQGNQTKKINQLKKCKIASFIIFFIHR